MPRDLGAGQALDKEKLRWGQASLQLDEVYSFVGSKANKQWLFLAYQADTKQIVAAQIGKRSLSTLKKPWRQIPTYLRKHLDLDFDTDGYRAYASFMPENQHFASKTFMQSIEAFNGRIISRVGRLVRKTRSFPKNSTMPKLAIRYFFYHSNLEYQTALHV